MPKTLEPVEGCEYCNQNAAIRVLATTLEGEVIESEAMCAFCAHDTPIGRAALAILTERSKKNRATKTKKRKI